MTRHQRSLRQAYDQRRRVVEPRVSGPCGFHLYSFRGLLGASLPHAVVRRGGGPLAQAVYPKRFDYTPDLLFLPLFTRVGGRKILRTSPVQNSTHLGCSLGYYDLAIVGSCHNFCAMPLLSHSRYRCATVPAYQPPQTPTRRPLSSWCLCDHQPITDEPGLAFKDPKSFIVYQTKRLLSFLRFQIEVLSINGATQIRHHCSRLALVLRTPR